MSLYAFISFPKLLVISFLITAAYFWFSGPDVPPKDYRVSSLLTEVVGFLDTLDATLARADRLAVEDPYNELVDQVKPAFEKVASIKKQTEIYEKMERIPGGPKNFMSTALDQIEVIAREVIRLETQYHLIVSSKKKEIGLLQDDYKKTLFGLEYVFDDRTLEELVRVGIYLNDPSESFAVYRNIGLESVKDKLRDLAGLFEELEALQMQQDSDNESIEEVEEELQDEINALIKRVAALIARDEHFFRLVMPKIGEKWKQLEESVGKIGDHQMFVKSRYEKLGDQLDTDVIRTRERINALKYPKKGDEF